MISKAIGSLLLTLWVVPQILLAQPTICPFISVAPNILVSRDDVELPHAETMLAINPKNPNNLIGVSIVFTNREYGVTSKLYVSLDGGWTWQTVTIPETARFGTVDPQIAFGADGTAYFMRQGRGQQAFRSSDGGLTWEKAETSPVGADHPQIVVDATKGKYAGRIYVSVMNGIRQLVVSRSEDGGRTYPKTVNVPNPRGVWKLNGNPLVLSDGTLFVPYVAWDDTGGKQTKQTEIEFVTSNDGGDNFNKPQKIGVMGFKRFIEPKDLREYIVRTSYPNYAVSLIDDSIYGVWSDDSSGIYRVYFTMSKDKGKTWSKPRFIDSSTPNDAHQYQVHIAVNQKGVVGVMWFDTRNAPNRDGYDLYFTASTDQGKGFSPPKRVSKETSKPISAKNLTPFVGVGVATKEVGDQRFRSAFVRWGNGGDYLGFTTDSDGSFHPLWIDSRTGVFQVFTAIIKVGNDEPFPKNVKETTVREKIRLLFDPIQYDFLKKEAIIPIRLQNISQENIYQPLRLEVRKTNGLKFINDNNLPSETALIDFSNALGDLSFLPPNAVTNPVNIKFSFDGLASLPSFNFDVQGISIPISK